MRTTETSSVVVFPSLGMSTTGLDPKQHFSEHFARRACLEGKWDPILRGILGSGQNAVPRVLFQKRERERTH